MALGGYPEFTRAIRSNACKAGVWLDVTLMGLLSFVALLNDHVCLGKPVFHVAVTKLVSGADV